MTELLERRLTTIIEAMNQGIVVQSDAEFMWQMLKAQARNVEDLTDEVAKLKSKLRKAKKK